LSVEARTDEAVHLRSRDRLAFRFRVVGGIVGLGVVAAVFATSSWEHPWVVAAYALVTVGGAAAYHLLTSLVRCPTCAGSVANWRIASDDATRKRFSCGRCGTVAWLAEGFYWQREMSG
jgi:hypothetical protein